MKYELETIPVWESFKNDEECPMCILAAKNEKTSLDFFLGDSVMDPDTRVKVNSNGFCAHHFKMMFESDHKLGVALMAHTHLTDLIQGLKAADKKTASLKEKNKPAAAAAAISEYITERGKTCVFCDRLERTIDRYTFTTVYLWKKDEEFKKQFALSKGFCMKHLPRVYTMAAEVLSGKLLVEFLTILTARNIGRLETIAEEVLWYTQKFDYRNKDKPWNNSKDALVRTLQKLKGHLFYQPKEAPHG